MLIECLQKRDEPLVVVSLDRFVYRFEPRPEETGSTTRMVCDVNSRSHAEHLLTLADFREFKVIKKTAPNKPKTPNKPKIPKTKARPRNQRRAKKGLT